MADEKELLKRIEELEKKLLQSNAQVKSIMDGLPFVSWMKDEQGKFIYVNEKFIEFFNHKRLENLVGKSDFEFMSKKEADLYKSEEDQIIKTKQTLTYNIQKKEDWFTTIKSPIITNNGDVIGTIGILRDITERVVNRSKYEFESNLLQALLDSIPDTIYFKDINSQFIRVNKAKALEVGVNNPDDLIGKSDADFLSKEDALTRFNDEQIILKTGIPIINKIEHSIEFDGKEKWASSTKCAIRDKQGNTTGLVGISRNVTDTQRVFIDLEHEKEFLQRLMDHIQHTIYFKDSDCRFTKINKAQAHVIGINDPDEAVGKSDFDFFSEAHAKIAYEDEKEIMRQGIPIIDKIEKIINAEGETRWVSATKYPIKDAKGNVNGIVGMSVDYTDKYLSEQKLKEAKEKAEESDRLKTAFLSNMSHEIRTPMNGIIGFSNLLRDPNLTLEERQEFLTHINNCGNQLLALIDDIIDISKIEAGQVKIQIAETHINHIFNELYNTFLTNKNNDGKTNVELRKTPSFDDNNATIFTDPFRLRQVLTNLIGNAIKFTSEGSVEFGYKLRNDDYLEFYVKDSGIGIPKDKQNIIFERFGQVLDPKTLAMNKTGTGLGLAISTNFIRLLGGDLWVESEVGKGTTFYFTLPYKLVKDPENISREDFDINTVNIAGKTILIAEDEETNFIYLREMLKHYEPKILWVKTGVDAIHSVKVNPDISIVLMDCRMPEMDGLTATLEIKKLRPNLPIVAQTAFALADERQKCIEYGCDAYISKPLIKEELFKIFKKLLG